MGDKSETLESIAAYVRKPKSAKYSVAFGLTLKVLLVSGGLRSVNRRSPVCSCQDGLKRYLAADKRSVLLTAFTEFTAAGLPRSVCVVL